MPIGGRRAKVLVERLRRASAHEIHFRSRELVTSARDAVRFQTGREVWRRASLERALAGTDPELRAARHHARIGRHSDAHEALRAHFLQRAPRFVIGGDPGRVAAIVRDRFPDAPGDALARASRLAAGRYALLGYADLEFRQRGRDPDWHFDPVHGRHAPARFWSRVPFLDPRCGDHKIIWELNRHQHWLALGRAAWLTGDARCVERFVRELESWLEANPPLLGINWSSMLELAFRSMSWIWALHLFAPADDRTGVPWLVDLLVALDRQLDHVAGHLSVYFSPNTHLLGEGLALYVAGRVLPELAGSGRWTAIGRRVLLEQADAQVNPDGGHAELSTHYHRYALDFYLLALAIARVTGDDAVPALVEVSTRLARYCRTMADDNGWLPTIGDDDGGMLFPMCRRAPADVRDSLALAAALLDLPDLAVGPPPEEVFWMLGGNVPAQAPSGASPPSTLFPRTGYAVMRSSGCRVILDVGPHGFLNGGHAHADALSIVAAVDGRPLLIDPGTSTYTMDAARRDRFRSSVMHNTLVLDGRSQAEPLGPFQWSSRVDARVDCWRVGDGYAFVEASHRAFPGAIHRRAVLIADTLIVVADHVLGAGVRQADACWHLAPEWRVSPAGGASAMAVAPDGARVWIAATPGSTRLAHGDEQGLGWCAPVYGQLVPSPTLCTTHEGAAPFSMFHAIAWEAPERCSIRDLALSVPDTGRRCRAGAALQIGEAEVVVAVATEMDAEFQPHVRGAPHQLGASSGTLSTDARLAMLTLSRDGKPRQLLLIGATLVRWTGPGAFVLGPYSGARDLHFDEAALRRLSRDAAPRSPGRG